MTTQFPAKIGLIFSQLACSRKETAQYRSSAQFSLIFDVEKNLRHDKKLQLNGGFPMNVANTRLSTPLFDQLDCTWIVQVSV